MKVEIPPMLAIVGHELLYSRKKCCCDHPQIRVHNQTSGHGANERLMENCDFTFPAVITSSCCYPHSLWQISLCLLFQIHIHWQKSCFRSSFFLQKSKIWEKIMALPK